MVAARHLEVFGQALVQPRGVYLVVPNLRVPPLVGYLVNSAYATARELLAADAVLVIKGRVDHKQQGETKLVALEISPFEATPERREVHLKVDARSARAGAIRELAHVVRGFPGEALVYVDLVTSLGPKLGEAAVQ